VSPPHDGGCPDTAETATTTTTVDDPYATASRQVSWWAVHEHVAPLLALQAMPWPIIGTPAWCALDDDDPRKLAALIDAAQHWAPMLETRQEARCDASRAISAATDWSALARRSFVHEAFYAARPWLKRKAS
jgi:hypothetical protein